MRINGRVAYIRYRTDGSIKSKGYCSEGDFVHQSRIGLFVKEIDDNEIGPKTHYVDVSGGLVATHVLAPRPKMTLALDKTSILADGVDNATLTGIPVGAVVKVHGTAQIINDGSAEITSDIDGEFEVTIEAFPNIEETLTVAAT